ncbi:MAG TPA: Coenzyme F420 hydrogenase/dehydrogenase, beta subunit C-terminal domain [Candidatus Woesebacteria bacterium]|nr:Coenzyme F420 hydrogenase/dehydrogenase, beta subunit C-terminal domain [Candidatus Woesebacteria bacterium]
MKVEEIYKNNNCTGCGSCVAVCPVNAISLVIDKQTGIYKPYVNKELCTNCNLCIKVCPGWKTPINQKLLGNYTKIYNGQSCVKKIREMSSSGGALTQILISLMKEKKIDGAIVTIMNGLVSKPIIATTKKELINAIGSKYCPTPQNIMLKDILKSKKKHKYAFVGLPCHIHGLKNMEKLYPQLKEKIYISLGLFCSRCPSFKATEKLLNKLNINLEKVQKIKYREKYNMLIYLKDKSKYKLKYKEYWNTDFKFNIPVRCLMCPDRLNDFCDISFGDDWESQSSVVIVRNQKALEIIQGIKKLILTKFDDTKIKMLKKQSIFKKINLHPRLLILKICGYKIPIFNHALPRANLLQYLTTLLFYTKYRYYQKKN